jgi:hypothetical protein
LFEFRVAAGGVDGIVPPMATVPEIAHTDFHPKIVFEEDGTME